MNTIDTKYQALLQDILDNGVEKTDRTGTGTISVFGRQIAHKMSQGFPLLTTKKIAWNVMVAELLWFLRGDTNIKFLLDYGCHIWDGDAYKRYENSYTAWVGDSSWSNNGEPWNKENFIRLIKTDERFCSMFGDLGPIYGKQWRNWESVDTSQFWQEDWSNKDTDQIDNLINELKTNPDSRRLMVSAWNVGDLGQMVLPPCHYGFQVYTRELSLEERYNIWFSNNWVSGMEKYFDPNNLPNFNDPYYERTPTRAISLMWNQRSVDTFLGLPFNIASYALLLMIIAKEVNMMPDDLIGNLGDVHLYKNHIEQAKEQISREPFKKLPRVLITERNWYMHEKVKEHLGEKLFTEKILSYRPECFELINYESHSKIKAPLSN
jgi:thymidylate synthase